MASLKISNQRAKCKAVEEDQHTLSHKGIHSFALKHSKQQKKNLPSRISKAHRARAKPKQTNTIKLIDAFHQMVKNRAETKAKHSAISLSLK